MIRPAMIYPMVRRPKPRLTPMAKKLGLFRAWASGHPAWIAWQVTYRCNMRCTVCDYWREPSHPNDELTLKGFREGSRRLAELGSSLISLAGGEPLVRDDIVDIIDAVNQYHFPFMTTNGWRMTPELAREIFAAGAWGVSVSLDYADAEPHDQQRGRQGAFDQAVAAIEALSAARRHDWQRVNVMAVLVRDNLPHIERLLRLAARLDAYFMVQPYASAKTGDTSHAPEPGVVRHLLRLRERYPNFLSNPYFLGQFDRFFERGHVPNCQAGRAFCNIDETGEVAICVEHRNQSVGNLLTTPPGQIVRGLHDAARRNRCGACWYNCRGEIESLYNLPGLVRSLPTYLFNRGRPSMQPDWQQKAQK